MLRELKWHIPGERLVARYKWCQDPAVEKHCVSRPNSLSCDAVAAEQS